MKNYFAPGILFCLMLGACAQPDIGRIAARQPVGSEEKLASEVKVEAERTRIAQVRAREEARFAQEHAACYARFAVNDCILKARARLRTVLDELRRQEVVLNDAERKRKALQQLERIKEKTEVQR